MDWTLVFGGVCLVGGGVLGYFFGHNRATQDAITNAEQGFLRLKGKFYHVEQDLPNVFSTMSGQTSSRQTSASSPSPSGKTPPKS